MQNNIILFLDTEKQISHIKNKINKYKHLIQILNFNYNINISHKYNYKYYEEDKKIPNIKINHDFLNKINILNNYSKQKLNIEYLLRSKTKFLTTLKNNIIDHIIQKNISDKSILRFKSKRIFPEPTIKINKKEKLLYSKLLQLQTIFKQIILIVPQYTLPVKHIKNLYADFFLLILHNNHLFPIIVEYDGPQHLNKHFYFSKDRIYADIIKNNFAISNCISILRCSNINNSFHLIYQCIQHILKTNTPFYSIPDYNDYINLLK
jgi:hypothetical protein